MALASAGGKPLLLAVAFLHFYNISTSGKRLPAQDRIGLSPKDPKLVVVASMTTGVPRCECIFPYASNDLQLGLFEPCKLNVADECR